MPNTSHEHGFHASTDGMTFECLKTGLSFFNTFSKEVAACAAYEMEWMKTKKAAGVTQRKADHKTDGQTECREGQ